MDLKSWDVDASSAGYDPAMPSGDDRAENARCALRPAAA